MKKKVFLVTCHLLVISTLPLAGCKGKAFNKKEVEHNSKVKPGLVLKRNLL